MFNLFESKKQKMVKKLLFGTEKEINQVLNSEEYKKIVEQSIKDKWIEKNNPPKYWGVLFSKETKTHWPNCVVCGFQTIEEINKHPEIAKDDKDNPIYFEDSSKAGAYRDALIEKLDLGYMVGYFKSSRINVVFHLLGMSKRVSNKCEIYRTKFGADNAATKLNNELKKGVMLDICSNCSERIACTKICNEFFTKINGQPFDMHILDFINRLEDKDANVKALDVFKNAEKCLVCGHENIVIVHVVEEIGMFGYCEKCQTLYTKGNDDNMFDMDSKENNYLLDDDNECELKTFKDAIKFWKKIGVI